VTAALVMLCSVCCLCEERGQVRSSVRAFLQDHSSLSQCLHLEVSKLLVLIEDSWFKKPSEKTAFDQLISPHRPLIDVVRRGAADASNYWLPTLSFHLGDPQFHEPYTRSHLHLLGGSPYISRFLYWTAAFVKLANFNLGFEAYISKLPDTRDPEVEQRLMARLAKAAQADILRENGQALQFVIGTLIDGGLTHILDPHALEKTQQTYKLEEPTVVLVLMGPQGLGKSTLLNYITQFCTEMPQLPDIFKVGNTGCHTTKGSQVLSHPLVYKEHQVMLMDLEGLGGIETTDAVRAIIQDNLVSALLTVASVPCLLVSNSISSLQFVSKTVAQIVKLQVTFGFRTERIYLLFNDKQLLGEHESSLEGTENQEFLRFVADLNRRYFEDNPVVRILNKPNFVAANGDFQRQLFLTTLLDNSLFVKKNASGTAVNILELLDKINLIATHETTDFGQLHLCPLELCLKEDYITRKRLEIKAIQYQTQSRDNLQLLIYFNEAIREEFTSRIAAELSVKSTAFRKHCWGLLESELDLMRAELMGVEACYQFIRVLPKKQMKANIRDMVKYFYKSAFCLVDFLRKVKALKGKLNQVKCYFPESSAIVGSLLRAMSIRRRWYIALSSSLYAAQAVLTVATVGVGAAVGASLTAARTGTAVAESAAVVSARIATGAAWGLGLGLGGNAVSVAGGLCSTMMFAQKAAELVRINAMWNNGTINEGVFKAVTDTAEHPHLTPGVLVLLFLGSKTTLVSEFANSYVRHMAPFTPAEFEAFSPNKYTQILPFEYYHPGQGKQLTRCYLLCLRMKKHPSSKYYHVMMQIAEMLVPAASVACILVADPVHYARPLLRTLCPPSSGHFVAEESQIKTKVLVLHKTGTSTGELTNSLSSCAVRFEMKQMADFRNEHIAVMIEMIKGELDRAEVQEYSVFRGKVNSLANAIKQSSS